MDDDGDEHPVAHFSCKLLPTEEKFSTIEKKCLAIKLACQAIGVYILGREFLPYRQTTERWSGSTI